MTDPGRLKREVGEKKKSRIVKESCKTEKRTDAGKRTISNWWKPTVQTSKHLSRQTDGCPQGYN
jgi:hypothetical protein